MTVALAAALFTFATPVWGGRLDFKRGKGVLKKNHWMQNGAEYLIEAFGFEHCTVRQVALFVQCLPSDL